MASAAIFSMTAEQAMLAASLTPAHSPAARLAMELCLLVGVDPHAFNARGNTLVTHGPSIPNWQFVIAEQLIGSALRISLRDGPAGGLSLG